MSHEALLELLGEIDTWSGERHRDPVDLVLLGGAALSIGWGSPRATKDLDVVVKGKGELQDLEKAFGKASGRQPWLDVVLAGLPRLPAGWSRRTQAVEGPWRHISVYHLAARDLIAAKLESFRPHDRRDIEFLCTMVPAVRDGLAGLGSEDDWMEEDIWEESIQPRRDRVLAYLDGTITRL